MIKHHAIQLALEQRLLTLLVCTTGSTTLSASVTGYARSAGSFIADGFGVGMELVASGFANPANNGVKLVTGVSALAITCAGTVVETAAAGRTLTVGAPSTTAYENIDYEPVTSRPFFEPQYLGGPQTQVTVGPGGDVELRPLFVVQVHVAQNVGEVAASRYADALLDHFPPRLELPADGHVVRVHWNPAPFRGQILRLENGFSFVSVSVPLWVRSPNVI